MLQEEQLKNDPFNQLWKDNFRTNYTKREFYRLHRLPVSLVEKRVKILKHRAPVIIVNPGPSLEKNILYLKDIGKKAHILCSDVCLYRLLEEEIIPDAVVTVDPSNNVVRFITGYENQLSRITLVAPTTCSPELLRIWNGPVVFYNQRDPHKWRNDFYLKLLKKVKSFGSFLNVTFVGGTMIQAAILFGATEILLVGWDFASDKDKNIYCKGFLEKRLWTDVEDNKEEVLKELREREIKRCTDCTLKSKDETKWPTIYTSKQLLFYKKILMNVIMKDLVKICPVINCTEGGILTEVPQSSLKNIISTLKEEIEDDVYALITKPLTGSKL